MSTINSSDIINYKKHGFDGATYIRLQKEKILDRISNFSGGESQRLKLVKHLLKSYRGHTVYFLDEPTVGLHAEDIVKLLEVIKAFLNKGDTVLMIEHDKNILKFADHIITLDDGNLVK